jgi:uncharacterized protein (TIGR02284 family)
MRDRGASIQREELPMATMTGKEQDVMKLLVNLIELDYDAIEAYEAAIERLEDATSRSKLSEFMADHERHTVNLGTLVGEMGGTPPNKGDIKRVLTKGKVVLGNIAGDRGILAAMKMNEDDTNKAYERAAARQDLPGNVLAVVTRNLTDERRHRAWIVERLEQLEGGRAAPRPVR